MTTIDLDREYPETGTPETRYDLPSVPARAARQPLSLGAALAIACGIVALMACLVLVVTGVMTSHTPASVPIYSSLPPAASPDVRHEANAIAYGCAGAAGIDHKGTITSAQMARMMACVDSKLQRR